MNTVGIDELKRRLFEILRQAEKGRPFLVTRHNKPAVHLTAAGAIHLHRGSRFGKAELGPAVDRGSDGAYLTVLLEDRKGPVGDR